MEPLRKWVLVVDDDPDLRELITNYLEMNFKPKVKVVAACDGVEATNRLPFQAFDCVITDLKMPRKEGQAFIKSIKQSPLNENTPIIVLTGALDPQLVNEYPSLHIAEKPLQASQLMSLVETQLKLGKMDQRIAADLLNSFIVSVRKFVEVALQDEAHQAEPNAKRMGDPIQGEVLRVLEVKTGKTKAKFALGFSKNLLIDLDKLVSKTNDSVDFKKLSRAAGSTIFNNAVQSMGASSISLLNSESVEQVDSNLIRELNKTKGLVIPMQTKNGSIHIQALWQ